MEINNQPVEEDTGYLDFRCRACRKLLFKFSLKWRPPMIYKEQEVEKETLDMYKEFSKGLKIEVKCPNSKCKTMNYFDFQDVFKIMK